MSPEMDAPTTLSREDIFPAGRPKNSPDFREAHKDLVTELDKMEAGGEGIGEEPTDIPAPSPESPPPSAEEQIPPEAPPAKPEESEDPLGYFLGGDEEEAPPAPSSEVDIQRILAEHGQMSADLERMASERAVSLAKSYLEQWAEQGDVRAHMARYGRLPEGYQGAPEKPASPTAADLAGLDEEGLSHTEQLLLSKVKELEARDQQRGELLGNLENSWVQQQQQEQQRAWFAHLEAEKAKHKIFQHPVWSAEKGEDFVNSRIFWDFHQSGGFKTGSLQAAVNHVARDIADFQRQTIEHYVANKTGHKKPAAAPSTPAREEVMRTEREIQEDAAGLGGYEDWRVRGAARRALGKPIRDKGLISDVERFIRTGEDNTT